MASGPRADQRCGRRPACPAERHRDLVRCAGGLAGRRGVLDVVRAAARAESPSSDRGVGRMGCSGRRGHYGQHRSWSKARRTTAGVAAPGCRDASRCCRASGIGRSSASGLRQSELRHTDDQGDHVVGWSARRETDLPWISGYRIRSQAEDGDPESAHPVVEHRDLRGSGDASGVGQGAGAEQVDGAAQRQQPGRRRDWGGRWGRGRGSSGSGCWVVGPARAPGPGWFVAPRFRSTTTGCRRAAG
jgi:hypothetical protein